MFQSLLLSLVGFFFSLPWWRLDLGDVPGGLLGTSFYIFPFSYPSCFYLDGQTSDIFSAFLAPSFAGPTRFSPRFFVFPAATLPLRARPGWFSSSNFSFGDEIGPSPCLLPLPFRALDWFVLVGVARVFDSLQPTHETIDLCDICVRNRSCLLSIATPFFSLFFSSYHQTFNCGDLAACFGFFVPHPQGLTLLSCRSRPFL